MILPEPYIAQDALDDWLAALKAREPRALELARALTLSLPDEPETQGLSKAIRGEGVATATEISETVAGMLEDARAKYEALTLGDWVWVDLGNPNVLAFERTGAGERLLLVYNLARVAQPVKFKEFSGREGWDVNRVEFTFPARAQLEPYEFLWLLVE